MVVVLVMSELLIVLVLLVLVWEVLQNHAKLHPKDAKLPQKPDKLLPNHVKLVVLVLVYWCWWYW